MKVNMNYILFDDKTRISLKPLTFTRPISEIRVGILTIKEKWEKYLDYKCSYYTEEYLQKKYQCITSTKNTVINSKYIPNKALVKEIQSLNMDEFLIQGDIIIAGVIGDNIINFNPNKITSDNFRTYNEELTSIENTYDIFSLNEQEILHDFGMLTKNRKSEALSSTVNTIGSYPIFIEEGGKAEFCTLNSTKGPIYIGKDAEIMEGVLVRGPLALCEHSTLNMGAKVYGATTIGPYCKCGGELNNVVFTGFSNKAHDGFLGNAVIGEWCNIGADTNNSNLKNTYDQVKLWNYATERFSKTGLQFCGLIMGDHSKFGINTMINTGTVIGVGCNIYGSDFPRNFIPSYSWGGAGAYKEHNIDQFFKTANAVMKRRSRELDDIEKDILLFVFNESKKYRNF